MPTDAYQRVTVQGKVLNRRTAAAFAAAQARGRDDHDWTLFQGSYNGTVDASGGTHDGGGAVDVSAFNYESRVHRLRAVGFAAWYRPTLPGEWNAHIHAVLIGDRELSDAAKSQVAQYMQGTDGLAGHGDDHFGYHPDGVVFDYPAYLKEQRRTVNRAKRAAAGVRAAIAKLLAARKNTDDKSERDDLTEVIQSLRNH